MSEMIVKKGHRYFLAHKRLHDVLYQDKGTPNPMVWALYDSEPKDIIAITDTKYDALAILNG